MRTLILSGSFREASIYARARGLRHYRYAASASQVEHFVPERIVELPGFANRPDKHALNAVARRAERRGVERVKDEYVPTAAEPKPTDILSGFDWLLGDVPVVEAFKELEAVQTPRIREIAAEPVRVSTATKARVAKKRSGNAAVPLAAESVDSPNTDDPFEA